MNRTICFFLILLLFAACTDGNKSRNAEQQAADTALGKAYRQSTLAYLIDGELYFHSFDENTKVKFAEEPEPILNFVFDKEGETLYYSVERENMLWLKSADISKSEITPEWVISWQLIKDNAFSHTGMSPLFYHEGKVIVMHRYHDDSPYFDKMCFYYIDEKNIAQLALDIDFIRSTCSMLPSEEIDKYFEVTDEQLYYVHNNAKVCLTDKIDFKAIEEENGDDSYISDTRHYSYYIFSPDRSKVAFVAEMLENDWVHGPYCIANVDGSKQMALKESNLMVDSKPTWLNNNEMVFRSFLGDLYVANNNKNSIEKIAEGVTDFKSR